MSFEPALAEVWVLRLDTLNTTEIARCHMALSFAERQRMRQFHFEQDRAAYGAAHALARIALSSYEATVPPHAWAFVQTPHGRPEICPRHGVPRLRFNISHTANVVACVVTRDFDCGVDVASVHHCHDFQDLAATIMAPTELAKINAVPDTERAMLFCRYWTLKEAYAKAVGLGMSLVFEKVVFELCEGSARVEGHSDGWYFEQWAPTPTHILATAIRTCEPVRLIRHYGLPDKAKGFSPAK